MAAVLPFERHVRWAQAEKVSKKVASELVRGAEVLASALGAASGVVALLMGRKGKMASAVGLALSRLAPSLEEAVKSAGAKLDASDAAAATKKQNLAATLERFRRDLDAGEERAILVRSLG